MNIVQNTSKLTESDYRKIKNKLSYSALKTFADNRMKFFKQYILQENQEDLSNDSIILGSLVDCLLFTKEEFDSRFYIASVEKPSGQMGELCDKLISLTKKYSRAIDPDEEYPEIEITQDFSELFQEATEALKAQDKFKGKDNAKILDLFLSDASAESYYLEYRTNLGKTIVPMSVVSYAQKLVDDVLNSGFEAGNILRQENSADIEVHNQLMIFCDLAELMGFSDDVSIPFKMMLDKVVIDHITKTIYKYDLKTTWENEDFEYNFLKNKYYLQLGVYDLGFETWIQTQRPELRSYEINALSFIALDSKGVTDAIVYTTDKEWSQMAVQGFTTRTGRKYKGVKQLIEEIHHHLATGNWKISSENHKTNGVAVLNKP